MTDSSRCSRSPDRWGSRRWQHAVLIVATFLAAGLFDSATAHADATAALSSDIDAQRGGCPALQSDPTLVGFAQRANRETAQYAENAARFYPFEDAAAALRQVGYTTSKAKMMNGFGDSADMAQRGVVVFGWEAIPDCSFTKIGVDALEVDGKYYATAILATP